MALSKPTNFFYELIGAYFGRLYTNPIKTRAITSCVTALLGNFISQKITGSKYMNMDTLLAFSLFGLFFGGSLPFVFHHNIYYFIKHPLAILLIERLMFMPAFQALYLYMLPIFEGKSHEASCQEMKKLYLPIITANLRYISLLQYINIKFIPPMLRIFIVNFIDLLWTIYVAHQRSQLSKGKCVKKCSKCS